MLVCDGDGCEIAAAVTENLAFRASRCSALGGMKKTDTQVTDLGCFDVTPFAPGVRHRRIHPGLKRAMAGPSRWIFITMNRRQHRKAGLGEHLKCRSGPRRRVETSSDNQIKASASLVSRTRRTILDEERTTKERHASEQVLMPLRRTATTNGRHNDGHSTSTFISHAARQTWSS